MVTAAWTAAALIGIYRQHCWVTDVLFVGNYAITEGIVTELVPISAATQSSEGFTVDGKHFSYSGLAVAPGFLNSKSYGGLVHEGLHVRISHSGDLILRIEVAR